MIAWDFSHERTRYVECGSFPNVGTRKRAPKDARGYHLLQQNETNLDPTLEPDELGIVEAPTAEPDHPGGRRISRGVGEGCSLRPTGSKR